MDRILIVKTSSLGDIVQAFHVLPYLMQKFPHLKIDWVVEKAFAEIVERHPMVERAIAIEAKTWKKKPFAKETWQAIKRAKKEIQKESYDLIFDLQGNIKSALCTYFAKGRKVGYSLRAIPEWPAFFVVDDHYHPPKGHNIREDYLYLFQTHFRDYRFSLKHSPQILLETKAEEKEDIDTFLAEIPKPTILVAPGAQWKNKQVREEALEHLFKRFLQKEKAFLIFTWGSDHEKRLAYHMHRLFPKDSKVLDKRSLAALQYCMASVDLVFAMDSLPLHLCGMTQTPSFSIFGPSSESKYRPVGPQHGSEQGSCPYGERFEKRCRHLRSCSTGICIRGYTGDQLFTLFYPFWKSTCHRGSSTTGL